MSDESPKIIVDDDWKREAQAEKDRLAKQEAEAAAASTGGDGAEMGGPITFDDLLKMLTTQALMYMGAFPDPQSGKAVVAPEYAKLYIDMLGVIEEKTKGNLTPEEAEAITGTLYELRMQFVELQKAVEQAIQEGRIAPGSVGGGAGAGGSSPAVGG